MNYYRPAPAFRYDNPAEQGVVGIAAKGVWEQDVSQPEGGYKTIELMRSYVGGPKPRGAE